MTELIIGGILVLAAIIIIYRVKKKIVNSKEPKDAEADTILPTPPKPQD